MVQLPPKTNRFIALLRLKAKTMIAHQAAFSPNLPEGRLPPRKILLHHRVDVLSLATAAPMPQDEFIARNPPVRHNSKDLVPPPTKVHRRKGKLTLHARKLKLPQGLPNHQIPIARTPLLVTQPVGHKTKLAHSWPVSTLTPRLLLILERQNPLCHNMLTWSVIV